MQRWAWGLVLSLSVGLGLCSLVAHAGGDMVLEAQLVWGTNHPKSGDTGLAEVDQRTRDRLCGVFKWQKYYQIGKQNFSLPPAVTQRVQMSKKCRLEVTDLGKGWVEVRLFGRKQEDAKEELVLKKKEQMKPGEMLVLAGDDVDDNAWFVLLQPAASGSPAPKR